MSAKNFLQKARVAFQSKDYAAATQASLSCLQQNPDSYDALLILGKCAYLTEDVAKAEDYYSRAAGLSPLQLEAWKGLLELFEHSPTDGEKALAPFKQIIAILEATQEDDASKKEQILQFQFRFSDLLCRLDRIEEAAETLKDVLLEIGPDNARRLKTLCLLADLQLKDYESAIQQRLAEASASLSCSIEDKDACEHDTLLNRVTAEYAEEALAADHELGVTLSELTSVAPPSGPYKKYHDFYLQIFCKAMYTTPANSSSRYNLRLQALECCYKIIHGRSGLAKGAAEFLFALEKSKIGLCTTPFPYVTALRLLEINEEFVKGGLTRARVKLGYNTLKGSKENLIPGDMYKSESSPSLASLLTPALASTSSHAPSPRSGRSIKLRASKRGTFDGASMRSTELSMGVRSFERRRSLDGHNSFSFRLATTASPMVDRADFLSSGLSTVDLPSVTDTSETALPRFMRSPSLSCIRKLHQLDPGFLEKPKHIIGGNSPLVTEISEEIGRRLARILPWHPESKMQMVLAIRRREKFPPAERLDRIEETPITQFSNKPVNVHTLSNRTVAHIKILERGLSGGTRMVVPRMALVDLLLQEKQYERALKGCEAALECIEANIKHGGYPRTQASLTFKLQKAAALLKLGRLQEAQELYRILSVTVSEGEISFGTLAGCRHVSVRQAALKGLVHVALARGERSQALRLYEQMMGAGTMGKRPIAHWMAADYGFMLYQDHDTVRAKQYLEKALDILRTLPSSKDLVAIEADYHCKLAMVYWALGGKWRAEHQFTFDHANQAIAVEGKHQGKAFELLGKYYSEVEGNDQKAKAYYERSLALDPQQAYPA